MTRPGKRRLLGVLSLCLLAVGARAPAQTAAPVLGAELLPAGRFERWSGARGPVGWTASAQQGSLAADDVVRLEGQRSLRLQTPRAPASATVRSQPVPCQAGRAYHARVGYRAQGLSKTNGYGGGAAVALLQWLDAGAQVLETVCLVDEYASCDWRYHDHLLVAPARTAAVQFMLQLDSRETITWPSTAWFDDVGLRPYAPPQVASEAIRRSWSAVAGRAVLDLPGLAAWFYTPGVAGEEKAFAARVRDPESLLGLALQIDTATNYGCAFASPYTSEQPAGLYRAICRLKLVQPPADPAARLVVFDTESSGDWLRGSRTLRGRDFRTPGRYEDFAFDLTKPAGGWLAFRLFTGGTPGRVQFDHIRVVRLQRFSDPDVLNWYPGLPGLLGDELAPVATPRPKALVVEGLLADAYRLPVALAAAGWDLQRAPYEVNGNAVPAIVGYPAQHRDLRQYRLVVLANAAVDCLGPAGRISLRTLVAQGGGLLILGGKIAYGAGSLRSTFLDELLPVDVAPEPADLVSEPGSLRGVAGSPLGGSSWPARLVSPYVHRVTARAAGQVAVTAGERPLVVVGTYQQGRVACVLGTPYASPWADRQSFTEAPEWPTALARLIAWLGGAAEAAGGKP